MIQTFEYTGIDYGKGITNIDSNNIRYGVIHQNEVLNVWCEESEPIYIYICPICGHETIECLDICEQCEYEFNQDDFDFMEPYCFSYTENGYKCFSFDDGDIFIEKSPYYTYAQFCSPCAPGACYLMNPLNEPNENNKAYCFSPDWFDEKPPYPIYKFEV